MPMVMITCAALVANSTVQNSQTSHISVLEFHGQSTGKATMATQPNVIDVSSLAMQLSVEDVEKGILGQSPKRLT